MSRLPVAASAALVASLATVLAAPMLAAGGLNSGVDKGATLSPFSPTHVTGPDKGTQTCPICRYPTNPAVQIWINGDSDKNVAALVSALEKDTRQNARARLKAFVVLINTRHEPASALAKRAAAIGAETKARNVSIVYLPGPNDEAIKEYAINTDPQVKNTVFVYKDRTVSSKFVNLTADAGGIARLNEAIHQVL